MRGRLGGIVGEQQSRRLERLAHPSGRVEAWREGERDRVEVHVGRRDTRPLQERGDARPRRASHQVQAEPRDRPVLADDRGDVGDRADRGEVGQLEGRCDSAGLVAQDQLGDLEGDATPRQPGIGIA